MARLQWHSGRPDPRGVALFLTVMCEGDPGDCWRQIDIEAPAISEEIIKRILNRHGWLVDQAGLAWCGDCQAGTAEIAWEEMVWAEYLARGGDPRG